MLPKLCLGGRVYPLPYDDRASLEALSERTSDVLPQSNSNAIEGQAFNMRILRCYPKPFLGENHQVYGD